MRRISRGCTPKFTAPTSSRRALCGFRPHPLPPPPPTPVAGAGGTAAEPAEYCELLEDLQSCVQRMESTVNDVLVFRQLDEHALRMELTLQPLAPFIARVCRQCRSFVSKTVALTYRVVPEGAVVAFDARRLFQMLMNGLRCGVRARG